MNLVIDIGNTRTKLGLFLGTSLLEQAYSPQYTFHELLAFGKQNKVKKIIISSVQEANPTLILELKSHFEVLEMTHGTPLPFSNLYTTPQTLGKDRLAGIAGAQQKYPHQNCLVIDCGTCIKYDLITETGQYLGGNIAPGAAMRLQAMHHFTAKLPLVSQNMPENPVGNSTESALQNGALRGALLEIEGFARLFAQKIRPLRVLICGGDSDFFFPQLTIPDLLLEPQLTLFGLNAILIYNQKS